MIEKPVSRLVQELDASSITVLGATCHGGIGAEGMHHFRSGLSGAEGDCIMVAGDVSPIGRDPYYEMMAGFIDAYATRPVHVLRGNHDGPDFEEYFGWADRAVLAEKFSLVMLDNSDRRFSGETLAFLRETMAIVDSPNVIVAFHVPPPNRISGNTIPGAEWRRFEEALGVWRGRITLLLCGHEHCYYEDDVGGIRLIVAGGGSQTPLPERTVLPEPYALEISFDDNAEIAIRKRAFGAIAPDAHSTEVHQALIRAYEIECRNLVTMRLNAEDAHTAGLERLAHFYRAASESGLCQARLLRRLLAGADNSPEAAAALYDEQANPQGFSPAGNAENTLAGHVLASAARTRQKTAQLLEKCRAAPDASVPKAFSSGYHLCTSCAMLFAGNESPNYCPACGAPYYGIREVR